MQNTNAAVSPPRPLSPTDAPAAGKQQHQTDCISTVSACIWLGHVFIDLFGSNESRTRIRVRNYQSPLDITITQFETGALWPTHMPYNNAFDYR